MRGFRGNRAAIDFKSAHFGANRKHNLRVIQGGSQGLDQAQSQEKKPLPDWLRVKEPEATTRQFAGSANKTTGGVRNRKTSTSVKAKTATTKRAKTTARAKSKVSAQAARRKHKAA